MFKSYRMKKYLLVIFGDFQSSETCKEIAMNITPLVDSPHLKFNHTQGTIMFHFASEVLQEEIYAYLQGTLIDIVSSFILSEMTDKVSLCLPEDIKSHLLDLENDLGETQMKINLNKNFNMWDETDDENFVALLLDECKRKVKRPSLDQILDKINKNGIEALSKFEKDTLDEYSQNY